MLQLNWFWILTLLCVTMMSICAHCNQANVNITPNKNYTVHINSTDIIMYKCTSSHPSIRKLVWEISCSEKGCVEQQLNTEEWKSGSQAKLNGWIVNDVATNETVLRITSRARRHYGENGGMIIRCQVSLEGEKYPSYSAAYYIKDISITPNKNHTVCFNSTDIITYKCSSSHPRVEKLEWVISCSEKRCREQQLNNEDLKNGSTSRAKGWIVDDVATNETVLRITSRARRHYNGSMKIRCRRYLKDERYPSYSPAYYIKETARLIVIHHIQILDLTTGKTLFTNVTSENLASNKLNLTYIVPTVF